MELTTLTDDELNTHRIEVTAEQERRAALKAIPALVATPAAKFFAFGGEQANLDAAITPTTEQPPTTA
ncbi:hypothetical protein [Cryobacterium aureum]|uniref:hypothetical protein n=1 Tax=Cryobacterium aureum TaxID=995037 RepID=UPI000CF41B48|nr:hypothetical protein [Cryobacterium aureum]